MGLEGNTFIDMFLHLPYSASANATVQYRLKERLCNDQIFQDTDTNSLDISPLAS